MPRSELEAARVHHTARFCIVGGDMNNPLVGYRVKFVLMSLAGAAGAVLASWVLPAELQTFVWGFAAGVLVMPTLLAIGWLMKVTGPADPVAARRKWEVLEDGWSLWPRWLSRGILSPCYFVSHSTRTLWCLV
jgi:hypothetical protein